MNKNLLSEFKTPLNKSSRYRYVGRNYQEKDTVININNIKIGGGNFTIIAGPCAIENKEQSISLAKTLKELDIDIFRGGAYKPRTSPYDFQGLGKDAIRYLSDIKTTFNMPIISEIMSSGQIEEFKDIDILQVGAKNMQNFELLKALGKTDKPILLKRGFANTIEELLFSAEYIMSMGNFNVILCERGIRTFENSTRNTFDINAIPLLKQITHLPVIADPSHGTGISSLVEPISLAAAVAGADGIMIEVHENPENALCDGEQSLTPDQFNALCTKLHKLRGTE